MFMSRTTSLTRKTFLKSLLSRSTVLPQCHSLYPHQRHLYASWPILPNAPDEGASVAILGGGITGLVSAFELGGRRPDLKITLFEGSNRLGGWLQSTSVDVGTGTVVFEQGPRNLRPSWPNGYITLDLVDRLGMSDRLLMTSKESPAAQNRFIYYPDHLVRMPGPGLSIWGNIKNIITEPVFEGVPEGMLKDVRTAPKRSPDLYDESIGSFISRRFNSALADNMVSAIFHGIYAGDIYKLSTQTILPSAWNFELLEGSVIKGEIRAMTSGRRPVWRTDGEVAFLQDLMKSRNPSQANLAARKSSVFTFKDGVGELANRLEQRLRNNVNVRIRKRCISEELIMEGHGRNAKIKVVTSDVSAGKKMQEVNDYSHVISTIGAKKLASLVSPGTHTPLSLVLNAQSSVTVMVVNLYYRSPSLLSTKGFGYLLPRSLGIEQNPERALGVIFDSDAALGQDAVEGTKLTVMLGGHWWDDFDSYPSEDKGALMARRVLERHLKITETPIAVRVSLQKNCIPQYEVGHGQKMAVANQELKAYEGRLTVAGSSYTGVGLNDCVKAGTMGAVDLSNGRLETGLGSFVNQLLRWEKAP